MVSPPLLIMQENQAIAYRYGIGGPDLKKHNNTILRQIGLWSKARRDNDHYQVKWHGMVFDFEYIRFGAKDD